MIKLWMFAMTAGAVMITAVGGSRDVYAQGHGPTPPAGPPNLGDLGDGNAVLAAITHQNLTLLPVVTTTPAPADEYLTLDEGMRSREVRIGEIGDGGTVNSLEIDNRTGKALFLMAGEVVIGGKQDRIIGKNTVVPARTKQTIPVFCVEHGRWSGRRAEFSSAGALAHGKLRSKANFKDQSQVWQEVTEKNAARRTNNETDTYRQVAAQQSNGTLGSWEKAFDAALAKLPAADRRRMVGYAVALNGDIVAVDIFGSPSLFAKLDQKLRRSYIAEAIDEPVVPNPPKPAAAEVRSFVTKAEAAPEQKAYESSEAETLHSLGAGASSTKVMKKAVGHSRDEADAKPVFKSAQKDR